MLYFFGAQLRAPELSRETLLFREPTQLLGAPTVLLAAFYWSAPLWFTGLRGQGEVRKLSLRFSWIGLFVLPALFVWAPLISGPWRLIGGAICLALSVCALPVLVYAARKKQVIPAITYAAAGLLCASVALANLGQHNAIARGAAAVTLGAGLIGGAICLFSLFRKSRKEKTA